ncbi:hypothetical protein ALC60_03378 [Trachymyrmex zeteki]|uniref:Uncharacterized protein n=1 Tax=Mycetomoellerius zeteki TaxID=64791 RepID=A0A151XAN3_9HYME|nr:hypothetical protein ALC60_03378 [Trachymyrmex zeteki]
MNDHEQSLLSKSNQSSNHHSGLIYLDRVRSRVYLPLEADIRTIEEPEVNIHDKRLEINDPLKRS